MEKIKFILELITWYLGLFKKTLAYFSDNPYPRNPFSNSGDEKEDFEDFEEVVDDDKSPMADPGGAESREAGGGNSGTREDSQKREEAEGN